ncbi:DUF1460 domain-containing protein [Vibrio cholerae]|nr:DUF1460 domain-containing protein [Vibrio cholerae]EJL6503480.1 DUF1460 domain-containing protein [Vibrio cholerae]
MLKRPFIALLMILLAACSTHLSDEYAISISERTLEKVNSIIENEIKPNAYLTSGDLLVHTSRLFMETPYQANTLVHHSDQPYALVVNFDGMDCFTYLDYVVALSQASDTPSFFSTLMNIRYKKSHIHFYDRKHFFSDWYALSPQIAIDITEKMSPDAITVPKQLNQKVEGGEYIQGLGVIPRMITYIPSDKITQSVLDNLQNGDLVGVYSPKIGLDVTHTGIIVKENNQILYRNASSLSKYNKVVDLPFMDYIRSKPGIVVLRIE